jgi:hypothetical protein
MSYANRLRCLQAARIVAGQPQQNVKTAMRMILLSLRSCFFRPPGKKQMANVENLNLNIAKVNSIMDKVKADTADSSCDPALITSINAICEAVKLLSDNQAEIISNMANNSGNNQPENWNPAAKNANSYAVVTGAKKSRIEQPYLSSPRIAPPPPTPSTPHANSQPKKKATSNDPPEVQRFKDHIREPEKSTLMFNLDMGKVPLLNTETISKRATLALATMAAKTENPNSTIPSKDSISTIDDVLSVTTGMTFYGSVTKSYKNPKDTASGSY